MNIYKAESFKYIEDHFKINKVFYFKSKSKNNIINYIHDNILSNMKIKHLSQYQDYHYTVIDIIDGNNINIIYRVNKLDYDEIEDNKDLIYEDLINL